MATIGQTLADARTRRGRSFQQLSEATRIPETVLRAMERDDFTACGGDFYARGHLRTLCAVLDLDATLLLHRFDTEHAEAPPQPRSAAELLAPPDRTPHRRQWGWTAAVAAAALTLTVLAWPDRDTAPNPAAAHHTATPSFGATHAADHDGPRHPVPHPSATTGPAAAGRPADTAAPSGSDRVTLRVTAHSRTWVSVTDATGTNLFTGVLAPGQTRDWSTPREVHLHLGDAGGVQLWVNGEAHGIPGDSGEVTRLSFTAGTSPPD